MGGCLQFHRPGPGRGTAHGLRRRLPDPLALLRGRRGPGLLALLDSDLTGPVNIGNPDERTVLEIADEVRRATGAHRTWSIRRCPLTTHSTVPCISLARAQLGWQPSVGLEAGLARTVAYFDTLTEGTERVG